MKLKTKFLSLYFILIFSLIVLTFSFYEFFAITIISDIEKRILSEDSVKVKSFLKMEYENLLSLTKDWAACTEAWLIMQDKNPSFSKNNITSETFINNKVNLIAYFDLNGNLKNGAEYDSTANKIKPVEINLWKNYIDYYISKKFEDKGLTGITFIEETPYFVSVFPVLKTDFTGPSQGYLIMSRAITEEKLNFIKDFLGLKAFRMVKSEKNKLKDAFTVEEDSEKYALKSLEKDVFGNPNIIINIERDKSIWKIVKNNFINLSISYFSVFLIFGIIFYRYINKLVIKRIGYIVEGLRGIKESKGESLKISGSDEISFLGQEINRYIENIEQNREFYEKIAEESEALIIIFDNMGEVIFANSKAYEVLKPEGEYFKNLWHLLKEIVEMNNWEKTYFKEFELRENLIVNGWILPVGIKQNYLIFVAHNVTSLIKERQKLLEMASKDALTSLYNRRFFEDNLKRVMDKQEEEVYSLIFMDLDDLKLVNDRFGHIAGDMLLKSFAEIIKRSIREGDIAARWGGDEFAIIVKGNIEVANKVAERIQRNIKSVQVNDAQTIIPSISIGIVEIEKDKDIETIVKKADALAYKAKIEKKS